ncbi:WG repeat-containing protein [Maribellus sp. CM-23]|uniref:WG repeat-containing protein n=1 Tax=Maribellus sp. CM-23 TaxID=2781026 RepID=UPI001F2D0B05|nr:WG repeat-containing protein [Maribellus sp. CM-23]MCE4565156.1 WG repeat-containing protein [Maribellus sp. CM-23]
MTIKLYILIFLTAISNLTILGQSNVTWTSFWNKDTTLIGYKDENGVVKIEPKFTGFTSAGKFENIIAVVEKSNDRWKSYYLTKQGKIIGRDSLHIFDNTPDCESEGFIRFRDKKNDKAGMFNKNGDIVIPAEYNDLTRVRNGMIIALKGAEKKYWDGEEHYSWIGGQELLIDTNNNVLIDDFKLNNNLNFFSLEKTETPNSDIIRKSFLAVDESYYSFVDFEKEFVQWLKKDLYNNLTPEKLINASLDTITWESAEGWDKTSREKFITDNFSILKNGLFEILQPNCEYFISKDGLNPFMFDGVEFDKYFNNCGEAKEWIYPTMTIIISHKNKKDFSQNHYEFLRTDNGYKLISVAIRNEKIR